MQLTSTIQSLIKDNISSAIQSKQLTKELLELAYTENWFNLWVPLDYGGAASDLKDGCALLEELAYLDGGIGWTITLCAGANMFAGYIDPEQAKTIFQTRQTCWGGSGKPSGKAELYQDHAVLHGTWKYATGAPHLTHFTLNAWLYEGGKPVLGTDGQPLYRSFFVKREDVLIHYDWDTFGLECTASHSFSVEALRVPKSHSFDLRPEMRTHHGRLFAYPFLTFAECTLAVNYIGMFRRFLDLVERQFFAKSIDHEWLQNRGRALFRLVDAKRTVLEQQTKRLYELMDITWQDATPNEQHVSEIAALTRTVVQEIKGATVELFPSTGITGAQRSEELNIVFRHLFTASQHALLNTPVDR
ncbi:acyl-CoA dehydrogenase family protein [Sphingobacterium suaedae]|uniref:Acyl-CoA dehydrogenase family protein n=1 Tax=Sphingobacterium suaedae TaxID=1686402 RepID=A0ABW5KFR5_9SPHI